MQSVFLWEKKRKEGKKCNEWDKKGLLKKRKMKVRISNIRSERSRRQPLRVMQGHAKVGSRLGWVGGKMGCGGQGPFFGHI